MVTKKASIPPLVYRGQPRGFGAIPSGTVYAGQLLSVVGLGQLTGADYNACLLYTSPSPRDKRQSRMPSSA